MFETNCRVPRRIILITLTIALILASSVSLGTIPVQAAGNTYYVATNGDDARTSQQAMSISTPWRTIQKAASIMVAGDTCIIRGGTYRETVTPANSGSSGNPITYQAYSGETVTVNGCDLVTGWSQYSGSIYSASIAWTMGKGKDEVFVDGNVVVQARYPNTNSVGKSYPSALSLSPLWPVLGDYVSVCGSSPVQVTSSTLLNQADDYWEGAIYNGGHGCNWGWQSGIVSASTNGSLTITQPTGKWWFNWTGADYFPENQQGYLTDNMNCLNYAGAWQIEDSQLYLWTSDSSNPGTHTVEAKKRQLAFDLTNKNYINITGLKVFACSITMCDANYCTIDNCIMSYISHFLLWDDIRDGYIDDYSIENNSCAPQRGEVGIYVGGQYNTIKNSTICYSAGAGIYMGGALYCTIINNNIHDCGYSCTYMGGILISYKPETALNAARGGHTITYNDIYNVGRSPIDFHSNEFLYGSQIMPYIACDISFNRIHDGCILCQDGGDIYSYCVHLDSGGPRTQVHNNLIYNVWGLTACAVCYGDNYTYGIDYRNNIIWQEPFDFVNRQDGPDGLTGTNDPNDVVFTNNTKKDSYTGGLDGLTLSDYPGGVFFATGSNHDDSGNTLPAQLAPPTDFVTSVTLGTLRNDFTGWVGMKITVGSSPLTVRSLGRIYVSGNSGTHTVKIAKVSDGTDVTNGSVSIPMSGGTAGSIMYADLATPVTLSANTSYYIVSQETNGGDQWHDVNGTIVTTTSAATCNYGAVYAGGWATYLSTNNTYVPVGFKYESLPQPFVTSKTLGALRNDFNGWVGMKITVGSSPLTVKSLGRICVSGNSGTHTVKIAKVSDGTDVTNGSVSISMSGGTAGSFKYADLATPVTLNANTSYYIVSQESNGGDQWHDVNGTIITTTSAGTCNCGAVFSGGWSEWLSTNQTYVPVDFKY